MHITLQSHIFPPTKLKYNLLMIELKDIHKSYNLDSNPLHVLKGINLSVEEGEIVAVKLPDYCLGFEATGWAAKYARLALAQVAR